jgi:hypothetical protein
MNNIKNKHYANAVMRWHYGRRWPKIKKYLKNLTVLKLMDRKKINEKDNAYIDYVMMKPGAIVELESGHILRHVDS